ncbi:MAG: O-antigen ligase family protein [Aggregatilineales bacterium]
MGLLHGAQDVAALAVFFLVPWWWRPGWDLPGAPYFNGFLITIPWALTLILWALTGFGDGRNWKALRPWLFPWLALAAWTFASQWWARFPTPATDAVWQLAAIMAFAVAMATAGPSPKAVIAVVGASGLLQALVAIGQVAAQGPIGLSAIGEYGIEPGNTGLSYLKVNGVEWLRPYGLTVHPNMLGGFLAVTVITVGTLLVIRRNGRHPQWFMVVLSVTFGLALAGLLLTFSRSAWIGVAVSGTLLIALCRRWRREQIDWRHLRILLIGAATLTLVFVVAYHDLVFARTGLGDESGELRSISDREVFMGYTLRMISQQPIIGLGAGMNDWASAQLIRDDPRQIDMQAQPVHNVPLLIWSELGVVGLLLWAGSLLGASWILFRVRKAVDPLALALAAGALTLFGIGLLDFYGWRIFHFGLLWWGILGVALHQCVIPRRRTRSRKLAIPESRPTKPVRSPLGLRSHLKKSKA